MTDAKGKRFMSRISFATQSSTFLSRRLLATERNEPVGPDGSEILAVVIGGRKPHHNGPPEKSWIHFIKFIRRTTSSPTLRTFVIATKLLSSSQAVVNLPSRCRCRHSQTVVIAHLMTILYTVQGVRRDM